MDYGDMIVMFLTVRTVCSMIWNVSGETESRSIRKNSAKKKHDPRRLEERIYKLKVI